ncbi:MAG: caspase family protein [Nitrospirae bacterium]|nr:caspase family protein [Nitrospirota bacterium]
MHPFRKLLLSAAIAFCLLLQLPFHDANAGPPYDKSGSFYPPRPDSFKGAPPVDLRGRESDRRYEDPEAGYSAFTVEGEVIYIDSPSRSMSIKVTKAIGGSCYRECVFRMDQRTFFVHNNDIISPAKVGNGSKVRLKYVQKEKLRFPRTIVVSELKNPATEAVEATAKDRQLSGAPPDLAINNIGLGEHSADGVLEAEEKGSIIIGVKNSGRGSAYNSFIKLELVGQPTKDILFNEKTLVGTIQPQEEKKFELPIEASSGVRSAEIQIKASVIEPNGFDSKPVILAFRTKELASPNLQVTRIDITDADGRKTINKGKEITVILTVHNEGSGSAKKVYAAMEAEHEGIKLFSGSKVQLGSISPGEYKKASFRFAVTQRYSGDKELPIRFALKERRDKFSVRPDIRLALGEEAPDIMTVKVEASSQPKVKSDDLSDVNLIPSVADSQKAFGENDVAVVIGIEKYQNLPASEFSYNDSRAVRGYLRALGFAERNIEFMTDERATLSGMVKSLENWLPNRTLQKSRVFVYYSGHGSPDPTTGEPYLMPHDGDPNYLTATAYPLKRFYESLSKLAANEVIVVIDSCFSGAGVRSVLAKGARPAIVKVQDPLMASGKVALILSTDGPQISTTLAEKEHGLFTYYFLKAIKDGKKDLSDIYITIRPLVEDEARRRNVLQTPMLKPSSEEIAGRFILRK